MKKVLINEECNIVYTTYTEKEYDRYTIDSILYQRCYQRISNDDWLNIFILLNKYKCTEMEIHKDSIINTTLVNIKDLKSKLNL